MDDLDLSEYSYEKLVEFFFDRAAPSPDEHVLSFSDEGHERDWSRPEAAVDFLTRMCRNFEEIGRKYRLGQVNQAIWMVIGADFDLIDYLWNSAVPLGRRIECIRSMYFVYSDFVSKSDVEMMENCFDMWWDLMAHSFWCQSNFIDRSETYEAKFLWKVKQGEVSKLDSESRALLDAMFETLEQILKLPDPRTQIFALHGLGHLGHPKVAALVQKYIDQNRAKLSELRRLRWAEQCRDGKVM
jgi:hypothetical protein